MTLPPPRHPASPRASKASPRADRGSGMIVMMLVMALVVALGATATSVSIGNLRGSSSAQAAGTALDAAEAGIAQATTYLRTYGTRKVRCSPTCTTNPWNPPTDTSPGSPVSANVAGGGRWEAWIKPIPPVTAAGGGKYLIHSTGTAGGPAQRILETEVTVAPIDLPKAIFGRTINLVGDVNVENMSVFSTGCVYKRDHLDFPGLEDGSVVAADLDLAYGAPPGVHSSQIITESNGSGQFCSDTAKPIHSNTGLAGSLLAALGVCNTSYPYDQDRLGGSFVSLSTLLPIPLLPSVCSALTNVDAYEPHYVSPGEVDVSGSFIRDDAALLKSFGIKRPALSAAEIEQLRVTAQAQGNYYESTSGWSNPTTPHSVLFFDLENAGSNRTVDLDQLSTSTLFSRLEMDASSPLCLDASLLVVIVGGDAKLASNTQIAASLYLGSAAPYGKLQKANGTSNHIGMMYADTMDLTGTLNVSLDTCYLENPPPALFSVTHGTYRELDR